ncbi:ATP-binding cassette domain-containing protein [Belliella kenyensis]|uniref:ATP-binding cassette domain-containing protein n=1 Tax=Belliella kenyensis TaxID=1472724 RepID=A0ABV8EML1_9BACT|nr:ATP-binding cassette domain-containing protein [Belliella kenyensis]MCH7403631.1 ATP-binding cassette domain-containing protein [Belliella kenyensis]MDN3602216.1 ATP-binding cassette domain-containing protein [Belliella kenyensis]
MIRIELESASKRFQYEWIFKNIQLTIPAGSKWAITGSNGSGKSTLVKAIAGINPLSEGKIRYFTTSEEIHSDQIFNHLTISAPYLELPEEFTLLELLNFHFKFKNPLRDIDISTMLEKMYLKEHISKPINQFSSGMKQRLKLGLCFFSDVSILILDEPTSNLDKKGIDWYNEMINLFGTNRTILVCSNDPDEYEFCAQQINIEDYKKK